MSARYTEVAVHVAGRDAELAAHALRTLAGAGVAIEHAFTQRDAEADAEVAPDAITVVRAWLADGTRITAEAITAALNACGIAARSEVRLVDAEDWADAWKRHFDVERYGARLVVVPSWRDYTPAPRDLVLRLDPGMAFGTGQHETTRMCLEALERLVCPGARVLDVGCGSGILALAAAKLGARDVVALDIDEMCVRVARENAAANGCESIVRVARGSLGVAWPSDLGEPRGFDVVVANIIARVIVELAPQLVAAAAPGGAIVVSGIIAARERDVVDSLARHGASVQAVHALGDWRCIEATVR